MKTTSLTCRVTAELATLPVLFASVCLLRAADQGAWPGAGIAAGPLVRPPCNVYLITNQSLYYCGSNYSSGSGTITNPWWGGFDYILSSKTVPGDTINLGPGTFYSVGSSSGRECLKAGQCLAGGWDGLTPPPVAAGAQAATTIALPQAASAAIFSGQDGITIENLTVDCDPNESAETTVKGVVLHGNNCELSAVTVLHSTGFASTGFEGWAIFLGWNGTSGNTVTDCVVSGSRGDKINGIYFSGGGAVAYNSVYMPKRFGQCINSAGANGATYLGNYCSGGRIGFYNDSYGNTNVTIANNQFVGMTAPSGAAPAYGLSMGISEAGYQYPGISNLLISGNLFQPVANPPSVGIGINDIYNSYPDFPIENVTITNNTIAFQGTSTTWYCTGLNLFTDNWRSNSPPHYFWNCYITHNTIQTSVGQWYVNNQLGMQQWTVDHNTDQNGAYLCPPYWPTNWTCTTYTNSCFTYP